MLNAMSLNYQFQCSKFSFLLTLFVSFHFHFHFHNGSLPFDLDNPIGYSIGVIVESLVAFYILYYLACFLSIALSAYVIADSINGFMKDDLQTINKMRKDEKFKSDILKSFSRFNRSYAEMKQLSK